MKDCEMAEAHAKDCSCVVTHRQFIGALLGKDREIKDLLNRSEEKINAWITRYEFMENWLAGILAEERKISRKEAIGQVQDACENFMRINNHIANVGKKVEDAKQFK